MYDKNTDIENIEKAIREVWGEEKGYHDVCFEKDRLINALQRFLGEMLAKFR